MLDQNLWGEFEMIEIQQFSKRGRNHVNISKDKHALHIPLMIASKLPWGNNERVNLYRFGETFALKPDKTGLLKVKKGKDKDISHARINSVNLCLELLSRTKSCMEYDAWVEEDVLFFKPIQEEK